MKATATQSESAPNASEAATASISLSEATGALRPPKPVAPSGRVMVGSPSSACANHPRRRTIAIWAGNIAAGHPADLPQALTVVNECGLGHHAPAGVLSGLATPPARPAP